MVTTKIGKHEVRLYDSIDELPISRFHKLQKLLLIDAGLGSDLSSVDIRLEKARRFIASGKPDKAMQELDNLRQTIYFIQNNISPKMYAYAVLVAELDGKPCNDIGDEALEEIRRALSDAPLKAIVEKFTEAKKKIDDGMLTYFPSLFDDGEIKSYYNMMRRRALAILDGIIAGVKNPDGTDEVERLTTALITFSNPKVFSGSKGMEVQYDRQFENLCAAITEQLHVNPKQYTVLEFYNSFEFLREKAKAAEKASKRR